MESPFPILKQVPFSQDTHLVCTHGHLDILTGDLEVADVLDVVARQLEDVRRDVLQDCHDVESYLEHYYLDKDTLKVVIIMRSHVDHTRTES